MNQWWLAKLLSYMAIFRDLYFAPLLQKYGVVVCGKNYLALMTSQLRHYFQASHGADDITTMQF